MFRCFSIDATWESWQQFHDDHLILDDWLKDIERQCKDPKTDFVTFYQAREELQKFEVPSAYAILLFLPFL